MDAQTGQAIERTVARRVDQVPEVIPMFFSLETLILRIQLRHHRHAVGSATGAISGRASTSFTGAGGGHGPDERRRKGPEPQTSLKTDDSTTQSPREGRSVSHEE